MNLSMWMIADRLQQYSPSCDIRDGDACISGVRLFSDEDTESFDSSYVYVVLGADSLTDSPSRETTTLINGRDLIILQDSNVNTILNDVLSAFDFYNTWEAALWEESAYSSVQRVIDLAYPQLENPMMLSDFDGNVLAMSNAYRDRDINEFWIEARNTGAVPASILGAPMQTIDGKMAASWSSSPMVYLMPDGTKTIGSFLSVEGEDVAGFSLWEYENPILHGDIWLVKVLCNVLTSMTGREKSGTSLRSSSVIISDLLAGVEIDADLIETLSLKCTSPWQLLVIDNPFRSDTIYKRGIVQRIRNHEIPCVSLIYNNTVVALVSQNASSFLLDSILGMREKEYYLAGLSLPFSDLRDISVRYDQVLFTLQKAGETPGIYYSENTIFDYFLSLAQKENKKQTLLHPALGILKQYDLEKQTELYETFYHYLLNERSILLCSKALHVHRNTYMYRLNRIKELLQLDLDDPKLRAYLLFSYFLDKA